MRDLSIKTERLDDVPLLMAQLKKMNIASLIDKHFPTHGNWRGISPGAVTCAWLSHILTEEDHCLDHVRPWVEKKRESLRLLSGEYDLDELDFADDHLAILLTSLSKPDQWNAFEAALNSNLIRSYDFKELCVRHDSTTSCGYRDPDKKGEGLFRKGVSKDHRPDLPQFKIMLATLDPIAAPLATEVLPGNRADDPLYVKSIQKVQKSLKTQEILHVGDSKMAARDTRAYIVSSGDYYLCPLPEKQFSQEELKKLLKVKHSDTQSMTEIERTDSRGRRAEIAKGFEIQRTQSGDVEGKKVVWGERLLIIQSAQYAKSTEKTLQKRIDRALEDLMKLNHRIRGKRRLKNRGELDEKIDRIVEREKVADLLTITVKESCSESKKRCYKKRSAQVKEEWDFRLEAGVNEELLKEKIQLLGWRVYGTNASRKALSLDEAILCYRDEYRIEQNFNRLKGRLSIRPLYLEREDRIRGLVHLLTIALRVLTLIEFTVREKLESENGSLEGLYPGNPKRRTSHPTTEAMLKAFGNITLTLIQQGTKYIRHVTELTTTQLNILEYLGFSTEIYTQLE